MWKCPGCSEQNEEQFKSCWKCQKAKPGAPAEEGGPEDSHLDLLVDPEKPVPIGDGGGVQCPTCGANFKVKKEKGQTRMFQRLQAAICPHCANGVTPELLVRIASGRAKGPDAVAEVIYACPYCGKVLAVSSS